MTDAPAAIIDYHQRTKHHPQRMARSLGFMDWATQPDPFRRYEGAERIALEHVPPTDEPKYDAIFDPARNAPRPMGLSAISQLMYDSLALSAWKAIKTSRWALRCNPSSGNLHPTEGYVVFDSKLHHYAPYHHALEVRGAFAHDPCPGGLLVGLTSIYWRESWKYGERAFRYCHHDVGHAIAAVAIAAALLGWRTRMVAIDDDALDRLLAIDDQEGMEAEHGDCLLKLWPHDRAEPAVEPGEIGERHGTVNALSETHHHWPVIDEAARAARCTVTPTFDGGPTRDAPDDHGDVSARRIIRQRRSAVAMDGRRSISEAAFMRMMRATLPGCSPFDALPWRPCVHLGVFVHRVEGMTPGVYMLVRNSDTDRLKAACRDSFDWKRASDDVPLYGLTGGDARDAAKTISCMQAIASDGAFALGMIVDFQAMLDRYGPWFYPRLYWETGVLGQVLYLEAEAAGVRSTGIGCFFDDLMHQVLGLEGLAFQSLYHFTVGGAVDDERLQTIPAYDHLER